MGSVDCRKIVGLLHLQVVLFLLTLLDGLLVQLELIIIHAPVAKISGLQLLLIHHLGAA